MTRRTSRYFLAAATVCAAAAAGCGGEAAECGDCYEQGYRVGFAVGERGVTPPPAVLFSGLRSGWCQRDVVCTGTPDVFLGDIKGGLLDFPAMCQKKELVAFGGGHAPTLSPATPSAAGQTITLNPAAPVAVTAWMVKDAASSEKVSEDVRIAQGRFLDLAAGITLEGAQLKSFPPAREPEVPALYENASCDLADDLTRMLDDPTTTPDESAFDPDRLNVYYVAGFSVYEGAPAGLTCADASGTLVPVLFVDGDITSSPAVLAHELGHALGLIRSIPLPGGGYSTWGHSNEVRLDPYLASDNLMRSGGIFVGQITLGQIYRMHFDKLSWLWHGRAVGDNDDYPRACQESPVEGGPCPALARHPSRGWPP